MENMTNESVSLFWENISVLYKAGVLQNNKAVKRFCDKLRIRTGYDRDQCLQGLSEMVFWLYAIKNSYTYEMDKKLKNQENTDVDIQLLKYGYKFNIEIKTPKQVKEDDDERIGEKRFPYPFFGIYVEQFLEGATVSDKFSTFHML